MHHRGLLVSD